MEHDRALSDEEVAAADEDERVRREATRARNIERAQRAGRLPGKLVTSVVGVSFAPTYPENLYALQQVTMTAVIWLEEQEAIPAILVREPDNPYDPNAVAVHVPTLGHHAAIGHLPRAFAARLAPELDAGAEWQAAISDIKVHPEHPDRPGIEIKLQRVDLWEGV